MQKPEDTTRILPVSEQAGSGMLYEMSIRLKADIGIKSIDAVIEACFPGQRPSLQDGLVLRMHQVVAFVPDDETLAAYARILEENYDPGDTRISNVRFDGYDYIYAIRKPETDSENADENIKKEDD